METAAHRYTPTFPDAILPNFQWESDEEKGLF